MRRCWTLQESMDAAVVCVTGRLSSQGLKVIHILSCWKRSTLGGETRLCFCSFCWTFLTVELCWAAAVTMVCLRCVSGADWTRSLGETGPTDVTAEYSSLSAVEIQPAAGHLLPGGLRRKPALPRNCLQ